jgi:hypothetical protein
VLRSTRRCPSHRSFLTSHCTTGSEADRSLPRFAGRDVGAGLAHQGRDSLGAGVRPLALIGRRPAQPVIFAPDSRPDPDERPRPASRPGPLGQLWRGRRCQCQQGLAVTDGRLALERRAGCVGQPCGLCEAEGTASAGWCGQSRRRPGSVRERGLVAGIAERRGRRPRGGFGVAGSHV